MTGTTANNRKYLMSGAAFILVAAGAYGLGRVYPPLGPSAGTIAPSQRYQAPQVGEGDITLGDTSVPELMQTDAFELMVKDPNFRALAASPGFQALAGQPRIDGAVSLAKKLVDDDALVIPIAHPVLPFFISERLGCGFVQPALGAVDLLSLCVDGAAP